MYRCRATKSIFLRSSWCCWCVMCLCGLKVVCRNVFAAWELSWPAPQLSGVVRKLLHPPLLPVISSFIPPVWQLMWLTAAPHDVILCSLTTAAFRFFFYPLYLAGHHPTLHYMLVIYPVCTLTLLFHTHTSSMIYCQWRLVEEVLASRAKPRIFFTAIVWDQWSIATHKLDLIVSDLSPTNPLLSCLPSFNSSSLPFLYGFWFLISLNLLRRNFNL